MEGRLVWVSCLNRLGFEAQRCDGGWTGGTAVSAPRVDGLERRAVRHCSFPHVSGGGDCGP